MMKRNMQNDLAAIAARFHAGRQSRFGVTVALGEKELESAAQSIREIPQCADDDHENLKVAVSTTYMGCDCERIAVAWQRLRCLSHAFHA